MALTQEELNRLKEAFTTAIRPIILFDDDHDGLTSFLMIYDYLKDGKGIPVKNSPIVTEDMAKHVLEYSPDIVIILDKPIVSQEFLDAVNTRVVWLDHHTLVNRRKVEYYNPRKHDDADNRPTSYWVYKVMGGPLWIAMVGMIGDWFMPEDEIRLEFSRKYPDLLPEDILRPEDALHNTLLGKLVRVINFNMKGRAIEVIKSVKVMTRIKDPYEILEQKTPAGTYIYKKFQKLEMAYQELLKQVKVDEKDKMVLFQYTGTANSFSKEISNMLTYKHPDKLILIAWEYNGEYKCSMRSVRHNLPKIIEASLDGVTGYGGGHEHASGACIKKEDFERFVENLRKQL